MADPGCGRRGRLARGLCAAAWLGLSFLFAAATPSFGPRAASAAEGAERAAPPLAAGWAEFRKHTIAGYVRAHALFQKAEAAAPDDPDVHAALAAVYWRAFDETWTNQLDVGFYEARRLAEWHQEDAMRAPSARAHEVDCRIKTYRAKYAAALEACRTAIAMDGRDADIRHAMAQALIYKGDPEAALEQVRQAREIAPAMEGYHGLYAGMAHFFAGDLQAAVAALDGALDANPELWTLEGGSHAAICHPCIFKIAALAHLGRVDEAQAMVATFMESHFGWEVGRELYFRPLARARDVDRLRSGLLEAGVPE